VDQNNRVLTGDRPTGKLHLGHYVGSLQNRVELQKSHKIIIVIADLHMLTTKPTADDIKSIGTFSKELVADYLAVGIDPNISNIYLQSAIPEIYELNLIFEMLVSVNRLSRLPSLKDMVKASNMSEDSMPFGLLGYPVLQAADILLPRANLVPIGKDNEAHLEITREIARKFNSLYAPVFPEPESLIGEIPVLMGTDGKAKMSKSINNCIFLSEEENALKKKVRSMYTDPNRIHANVPGTVEGNPVFQYLEAFTKDTSLLEEFKNRYRSGTVGDGEVKDHLFDVLNDFLKPIRSKREEILNDTGYIEEIILNGTEVMRSIAVDTMREVRKAMGFYGNMNKMRRSVEKRKKKQQKA
jgi:tryptophanyl-tRNA synthetase